MEFCESREKAEMQVPKAREKNKALSSASIMRQNSAPVTPPTRSGRPVNGRRAKRA